jgi:hypothetical protein
MEWRSARLPEWLDLKRTTVQAYTMSRRWVIILCVLIVALAAGLEWALRYWGSQTTSALVVNEGTEPMHDVFASYADTRISLGTLAPGEKGKAWFSAAGRGALKLEFTQKGNSLTGFNLEDFDPTAHRRDGSRLVLVVKSNQVERYVEDDDSVKSPPRLLDRLMDWIKDEIH